MLKRLLVAVFVLGLLMAFSGTAISGPIGVDDYTLAKPHATGTQHIKGISDWANSHPPQNQRVPVGVLMPGAEFGSPADIDTSGCTAFDYTHLTGCGFYAWWTTSAAGAAEQQFSMRFDIPASHSVNVTAARVRVYAKAGAPSLVVSVYNDNSGIPGTLVYSQGFVPSVGNNLYTFTTPVNITNGGPYHIGIAVAGVAADSVRLGSDDGVAGTGRGSYSVAGVWYPNSSVSFGVGCGGPLVDPNWRIVSNVCQYYTSCGITAPGGTYFRFALPDPGVWTDGSVLSGTGQRFKAEGQETLTTITFVHRVVSSADYTAGATNGLIVKIWGDSAGYARLTPGPLQTIVVPAGIANLFPVTLNIPTPGLIEKLNIPVPGNPVMLGFYHVTVEMSGLNPANGKLWFRFGDGSSEFGGGMVKYNPPGSGREWDNIRGNANMCDEFYGDATCDVAPCDIRVTTCKSEFSECKIGTATSCGVATRIQQASMTPPGGCTVSAYDSWAQRIKGNPVNLIDKIRVNVVADFNSGSCVSTPGATLRICVWKSVGNAPGPLIAAYPVTPIVSDPGWNEVVIPGGLQVLGDFFIGYDITLFGASEFIWATFQRDGDAGPCKPIKDGAWVHRKATVSFPNEWWNRPTNPNITQPDNLVAEVDFCAIPLSERACVTENDWPTFQHDFARTGASGTAVGSDAYCDLTLNWKSIRPTGRAINLNGPIIWNGYVICAFSAATAGSYVIFNLATGAIVDEIKDATWGGDNSVIGGNIRCTPTVATIGGNPVLLIVGGNPGSVSAFNLTGGFPLAVPASKMWTFTAGGTIGATRYGNIIVQNIGGTDVVFVAADDNKVYAINGLTGASYGGWASPYTLTFNPQKAGATDGTDLFYSMFNPSGNSKITAIKASNGTMDWEFTGLQGASLFTGVTQETFEAGVSTADGEVYANSRILDGTSNVANLSRGVFYRLNASTGAMLSAVAGERARTTTPVIDARRVIVTTLPRVTGASATGGQVIGFTRIDGALDFSTSSYFSAQNGGQMGYFIEGLLTCEPDSADFFYAFNIAGYLSCFNADNGRERYHRRIDHAGANQGGMGAIGKDGSGKVHLVFVDAFGSIYDMTKQSPRARLELLSGGKAQAVPFGSLPSTIVTFPKMYTNTGCTNLLVSLKASTTSNGTTVPAPGFSTINSRLDRNSSSIADMLSFGAEDLYNQAGDVKRLGVDRFSGSTDELPSYDNVRQTYNQSAAAVPAFLNQVGGSYVGDVFVPPFGNIVTAPGDTAAIKVDVNGPLVNRGPNSFYIEYSIINDPDYYLDNPARRPELFMSLVGGCLPDTTALHFGTGGVNYQWVSNTGRFGTADWSPDGVLVPYSIKIDGVVDGCFAGTYVYGVSDRRIAVNAVDWIGGSTENESWISMQGDPNFCDASCKPALQTGVALPAISTDGITYTPIIANVVCKSYIDSVQNFDDGAGGWDWELYIAAPFDNDSTMGLKANTKTYGIPNGTGPTALLNNMTLEVMTFTERNGNAVPGWKIGMWSDNDVRVHAGGPRDTTLRSAAYSAAWASSVTLKTCAAGWIKVPFGCGYSPLKNALAMNQRQGMYPQGAAQIKWDSVYKYMSRPAGLYSQNLTLSADDQNSFYTFDENDFGPNGSHKVGLAFFLFDGMTDSHSATADNKINKLAILLNQLSGFGRGDVNNDGVVNLADIVYLASNVSYGGPGPIPFVHLGDVNLSGGAPTIADVTYLVNYYFSCGPCPMGEFVL